MTNSLGASFCTVFLTLHSVFDEQLKTQCVLEAVPMYGNIRGIVQRLNMQT